MQRLLLLFLLALFTLSCRKEKEDLSAIPPSDSKVNFSLNLMPYQKLSTYNMFEGDLKDMNPVEDVMIYEPASMLFTDYAHKKRFIWMPYNVMAKYVSDDEILDMPIGTILIKHFYYDHVQPNDERKIIETRVMIHKLSGWKFAEYVWNDDQTEAYLDMDGSYQALSWIDDNAVQRSTNYRIPSETECLICHKENGKPIPIGVKPQNINNDYNYSAGTINQLDRMIQLGYLESKPANIVSTIDYNDASHSIDLRFRSYVDINCAHCHREGAHCDYRPLRLAFSETENPQNLGLCVEPDEVLDPAMNFIISPSNINRSLMHFRLNSVDENVRMPLLGRTLVHDQGVAILEEWINSKTTCN